MSKLLRSLTLVALMIVPWVAGAQSSLIVANGTSTNRYIPIYGYYADAENHNQMIYPSAMLSDMAGSEISSITYYLDDPASSSLGITVTVKMKEVTQTTLTSLLPTTDAITVWTGAVSATTDSIVMQFTTPYLYSGGNLLVDVTTTEGNYSEAYFAGTNYSGYNYSYWSYEYSDGGGDDSGNEQFLPKTRFVYSSVSSCPRPVAFALGMAGTDQISFHWTDTVASAWTIAYGPSGFTIGGTGTLWANFSDTLGTIYNLTPNTQYDFYLMAICASGDSSSGVRLSARTDCAPIALLPYEQDFESETTGGNTSAAFVNCWNRLNNGTQYYGYPYVSATSSYNHTTGGTKSFYWYSSTTVGTYGDYQIAVLPGLDTSVIPINTTQLSFWAKASASTANVQLLVGVMTNPNDPTTFQTVATVAVGGNTAWERYIVPFSSFTGHGSYVAIRANRATTAWTAYMDDVSLTEVSTCPPVTNLAARATVSNVAVSWDYMRTFSAPTGYEVVYDSVGSTGAGTSLSVTDTMVTITGLEPGTDYKVYVTATCGIDNGETDSIIISTLSMPCLVADPSETDTVEVGTGTNTSTSGVPVNSSWGNTFSETVFTAAELAALGLTAGSITGIDIYFTANTSYAKEITVFLGTTTLTAMSSSSSMVSPATLTQVYGPTAYPTHTAAGWRHFEFTTPFDWDGASNILLATFVNQPTGSSQTSSGFYGRSTTMSGNSTVQRYKDSEQFTVSNALTTGSSTTTTARVNVVFYKFGCAQLSPCAAPLASVDEVDTGSVTISWLPGYDETLWNLDYRVAGASAWTSASVGESTTSYTFTGLNPATNYELRVSFECTDAASTVYSSTVSARTECAPVRTLPYEQNFELCTTGSGVQFDPCWTIFNNYSTSNYPYATAGTGNKYLTAYYYSTGADYYNVAMLPELGGELESYDLELGFDIWGSATATYKRGLIVALFDSASYTGTPTFDTVAVIVPAATATSASTAETKYVAIAGSSLAGKRLGFFFQNQNPALTSAYYYTYIDNVSLHEAPNCGLPHNLALVANTDESLTLTWSDTVNSGASYRVEYRQAGVADSVEWTGMDVYDTTTVITNLASHTTYDVRVCAVCNGSDSSSAIRGTYTTLCGRIRTLPFTQNFEQESVGGSTSRTFVDCWNRLNNGTTYYGWPYVSATSTYNHTTGGTKGFYWYSSTTAGTYGDYQIVVLPAVDTDLYPINTLELSFWAKATASNYNVQFQIGVMTDPDSVSTFQAVRTVNVGGNTTWEKYRVMLGDFAGHGSYVAIRANRPGTSWYAAVDDINLDLMPACAPITDIEAIASAGGARLTWSIMDGFGTPDGYTVVYDSVGSTGSGTSVNVTDPSVQLTGFEPGTDYKVYVTATCSGDEGEMDSIIIRTLSMPCLVADTSVTETVEVGTGTNTSTSGVPVYSGWGNTFSETVFSAAELSALGLTAGPITGIDIYFTANTSYAKEITVFLGTTTLTAMSSSSSMVSPATLTQVYGPTAYPTHTAAGWRHFEFTTPFDWDGASNILLATFVNQPTGTSQSSSGFYGRSTTTSGISTALRYKDSQQFTVSNALTTGSSTTATARVNVVFYEYGCAQLSPCAAPAVAIDSIGAYSATISWLPGYDETSWNVDYRVAGSGSWTSVEVSTTGTSHTFDSLTPNTEYEFRVSFECTDASSTVYSTTVSATTECAAMPLPFTENFDSYTTSTTAATGVQMSCWDYVMTGTATYQTSSYQPQIYYNTTNANSGRYCLRLYGVSYCMLPEMAAPVDSLQLVFNCYATSANYKLAVGVMEADGTFVPVDTVVQSTSTHTEVVVNFDSYQGPGGRIAFRNYNVSATTYTSYIYIDDIYINYMPSCARATGITLDGITSRGATVHIHDTANVGNYIIYARASGMPTVQFTTTDTVYDMMGLLPNTVYDIEVTTLCADEHTTYPHYWNFRTNCGALTELPMIQTFENESTGSSSNANFMLCWKRHNNATTYYGYPYISGTATCNHTSGGTKGLYWYTTSTTGSYGDYEIVVLPELDTVALPINTVQLSFWAMPSAATSRPQFIVGTMTDPDSVSTFVPYQVVNVNPNGNSMDWQEYTVEFDNFTGVGSYIAIRANRSPAVTVYMDDIMIDSMPTCKKPTDLAITDFGPDSIVVEWVEQGEATAWQVVVGTPGFEPDTAAAISVSDMARLSITGLDAGTSYEVYVRADCNSDGISRWAGPLTIQTPCEPIAVSSLPYRHGFENATASSGGAIDPCWLKRGYGSALLYPYASTSYHAEGSKSLYFYNSGSSYSYAVMPLFDTTLSALQLDFKLYKTSSSYCTMEVGVMTNPLDVSTFTPVGGIYQPTVLSTWEPFRVNLNSYRGNGRYIAFLLRSGSYAYLDDVTVSLRPSCPYPVNLAVSDVSATSAYATWSDAAGYPETPDSYRLTLIDANNVQTIINNVTDRYYLLTGLTAESEYTLRVEAECNSTYTETATVTFSTIGYPCAEYDTAQSREAQIGTGTTSTSGVPVNSSWGNTVCQSIWTASELTAAGFSAGKITGLRMGFQANTSYPKLLSIYMGNTTQSTYSSETLLAISSHTRVLSPTVLSNTQAGWHTYDFDDTTFVWDGTSNLVVTFMVNQPDNVSHSSSSFYGYSTNGTETRTAYRYRDAVQYNASNLTTGSGSTSTYRPSVTFYRNICIGINTCIEPLVEATYIGADSVGIAWAPGNAETSWTVSHRAGTSGAWTTDLENTTLTSHSYGGLQPNTRYTFRVSTVCEGETIYTDLVVNTPCLPVAIPFTENFSSWTTASSYLPSTCWHKGTNNTSTYPYVSSSYSMGDSRALYMYSTSSTYSYLALPLMDAPIDTLSLTLYLYKTNTSYTHALQVGVMTDPTDINTFTSVSTVTPTQLSVWEGFEVNFAGAPEGYIAIVSPNGVYSYPYVDNIEVNYYNPCERPSNVRVSNITRNSAILRWNGNATGYEVEYGLHGFTPGTGTTLTSTATNISLTGLAHSTDYDVYVRGVCGDNSYSSWSFVQNFATPCAGVDTLPFVENFNTTDPNTLPACWSNTGTTSASSYGIVKNGYSVEGSTGRSVYMYSASSSTSMISLPAFDTSRYQLNNTEIEFRMMYSSSSYAAPTVVVGLMNNPGLASSFVPIDTVRISGGINQWETFSVPFNNYTGDGLYISLKTVYTTTYSYFYIDNIEVQTYNPCRRPYGIQVDSVGPYMVALSWLDSNNANSYRVYYADTNDFASADSMDVSATNAVIRNLRPNTRYYLWLATNCGSGLSRVTDGGSVTTDLTCYPITDLRVTSVASAAAAVSWSLDSRGNAASSVFYTLTDLTDTTIAPVSGTTTAINYHMFSGLTPSHRYRAYFYTICTSDTADMRSVVFSTPATEPSVCLTIGGSDNSSIEYAPFDGYYNYSYAQTLYPASQLAGLDSITGLGFRVVDNSSSEQTRTLRIWMANTTQTAVDSGAILAPANMQLVASNAVVNVAYPGWTYVSFDSVFRYNGTGNLVVAIENQTGEYDDLRWGAHVDTLGSFACWYSDDDSLYYAFAANYDENINEDTYFEHNDSLMPDIKFAGPCTVSMCPAPLAVVSGITTNSATLTWVAGGSETAWIVEYAVYDSTTWSVASANVTALTYTISGLQPATRYKFRVGSLCTADTVYCSTLDAYTNCAAESVPIVYNGAYLYQTTTALHCWQITGTSRGSNSGNYYRYFSSSSNQMILPEIVEDINALQISIDASTNNTSGSTFRIGVLEGSAVVWVDTVTVPYTNGVANRNEYVSYLNGYTGNGHNIVIGAMTNNYVYFWNIAIDSVETCMPVTGVHTTAVTGTDATIAWSHPSANQFEVQYRTGNNPWSSMLVTGTTATIFGLDAMTEYEVRVRAVCSPGDSSVFRNSSATFRTDLCNGVSIVENFTATQTQTTSTYTPIGYSFYNYSYVQTIIDSAQMASVSGAVTAMAFYPTVTTAGSYFNSMEVFLANVSESNLTNGFVVPDATHQFVQVINSTSFNYTTTGWQMHGFDTPFMWDGHSNVLVAVKRSHGSYQTGATFRAHTASASKARYVYNDDDPYNINSVSGGTATSTVGDIRLYSCGGAITPCDAPVITNTTATDATVTVDWTADHDSCYVAITDGQWSDNVQGTLVANGVRTHTFTGLTPNTTYTVGVRQQCGATSLSSWTVSTVTTSDVPCLAVSDLRLVSATFTSVTVGWTPAGQESAWNVRVYSNTFDTTVRATMATATVGGLQRGVAYNVLVQPLCGSAASVEGPWNDTPLSVTTADCDAPSYVSFSDITSSSVKVAWETTGGASAWRIEYGYSGFSRGEGVSVDVQTNPYTLTGLEENTTYDVYVATICGSTDVMSVWSQVASFTTSRGGEGIDGVEADGIALYPNPASGSVTVLTGEAATVSVIDQSGREVRRVESTEGVVSVNLEGMASGAYYVRVVSERATAVRKLIVR